MQDAPEGEGFVIFNQEEQEIIRREFTYNNPSRFNRNELPSNPDAEPWDCFTELNLDSMNATLRNASSKSVILAPFNSSVSDDREFERVNKKQAPIVEKKSLIKFAARCRD
jgi:uridine kinase